jgi:hypothetical protein
MRVVERVVEQDREILDRRRLIFQLDTLGDRSRHVVERGLVQRDDALHVDEGQGSCRFLYW